MGDVLGTLRRVRKGTSKDGLRFRLAKLCTREVESYENSVIFDKKIISEIGV